MGGGCISSRVPQPALASGNILQLRGVVRPCATTFSFLPPPLCFLLRRPVRPPLRLPRARHYPRQQITVTGTDDFRFNPSTITVKAGQPLEVTFQNGGEILHDFTVQQGLAKPVVITEDGGKSGTATVTYDKPGTYKFFCSQPGHDQLGMHGTITVQ